jgi:hypothetical protein
VSDTTCGSYYGDACEHCDEIRRQQAAETTTEEEN